MHKVDERSRASSTANAQISISEDEKKFFSEDNNFIEYFIEIGVKPDIFENDNILPKFNLYEINSKLKPEIISKFPYFDKKSMAIDSSIIDYVFPNKFKAIMCPVNPDPEFYSLMLDNQFYSSVYSYKYFACLVIYENLNIYKKVYDSYSNNQNSGKSTNNNFNNIYVPKCLCLASLHPAINKFELILREIYRNFEMKKSHFFDLAIEKLISQTPKIPRGLKRVYLKISDNTTIDLTETKINELLPVGFNLKELFSLFKIDKIVDIFKFMLYELKIIFFSSKITQITNIIMSFLLLLKPFTYQYRILSVLPKDLYFFLEDENPCIFGVNELFYNSFFEDNKLQIIKPIVVVDIDKKDYYLKFAGGDLSSKDFPLMPKHLREKLDKRTEEYKKTSSKKKEETNEGYQEIFFRFMINLLKDYPKFLKKSFNGNSYKVQEMIDKQGYINSQSTGDKDFYEKIINSQMFDEFITKRMMPKDTREKIQALFFEEKLNVKYAQKKIIRGNKILEQNALLPSKEYDYKEPKEIIDISETSLFSRLDNNTAAFFSKPNINKEVCLPLGYMVREGISKNELSFDYYLFPALLSDKLFKFNCKNYITPQNLCSKIAKINEDIIHSCFIKFDEGKKNKSGELINDVYISYIILFSLSLWYTDKKERESRFNNMLQILGKIEKHDMEVTELLFNTLIKLEEEQLADILYTKYNQMHINLTWTIFSLMSKILHKKQNIYAGSLKESVKSSRGSIKFGKSLVSSFREEHKKFRTRSIKLPDIDDDILGEEILFDAFGTCLDCKCDINLEKICIDLSNKELDKINRFKCKCNNSCLQKLNFKIGTELYNQIITKNSSSVKEGIILYCPTTLKKKLLTLSNIHANIRFDVEKFRINYPDEFWNSVWYFELKGIDISFMLPYIKPITIELLSGTNKINNYIEFIMDDTPSKSHKDPISFNQFKNPNNKIEKIEKKINVFNDEILFIQHVYQISFINIIGMIMYKSPEEYVDNISFNEKILLVTEPKNKNQIDNEEIKENKKEKDHGTPKKSNLISSNIIAIDLDLISTTSTQMDDYNKLMNGNFNIDEETQNFKKNKDEKQNRVKFASEELFECIKEDDACYNIFNDYREDDDSDEDEYGFTKK